VKIADDEDLYGLLVQRNNPAGTAGRGSKELGGAPDRGEQFLWVGHGSTNRERGD
jgi:hypothetical protein